jgi:hypothetical protein
MKLLKKDRLLTKKYPKTLAGAFQALLDLLRPKDRWTQRASARLADGTALPDPCVPDAVCFCVVGAVGRVACELDLSSRIHFGLLDALDAVSPDKPAEIGDAVHYNDAPGRTHRQVLALVKQAQKTAA